MKRISLKKWKNKSVLREAHEFEKIGMRGVESAIRLSLRKKIPLVFSFGGLLCYLLPDGKLKLKLADNNSLN
jgi:hypothetical protein